MATKATKKGPVNAARRDLDQFVLTIEFLLVSFIQGSAVGALARGSTEIFQNQMYEFYPYMIAGFLVIFLFWTQAIVHIISFIDWPLYFPHTFLYFIIGFTEILLFQHLADPKNWFIIMLGFSIVVAILYYVDLKMIRTKEEKYVQTSEGRKLYDHIYNEHVGEFKLIVPGLIFANIVSVFLILTYPETFIGNGYHLVLILLSVAGSIAFLLRAIYVYRARLKLIKYKPR